MNMKRKIIAFFIACALVFTVSSVVNPGDYHIMKDPDLGGMD
jgi:hypothetical protein